MTEFKNVPLPGFDRDSLDYLNYLNNSSCPKNLILWLQSQQAESGITLKELGYRHNIDMFLEGFSFEQAASIINTYDSLIQEDSCITFSQAYLRLLAEEIADNKVSY